MSGGVRGGASATPGFFFFHYFHFPFPFHFHFHFHNSHLHVLVDKFLVSVQAAGSSSVRATAHTSYSGP